MAAACQLLVMAVLVVMASCLLRSRGDDGLNGDRIPRTPTESNQMQPSEYTIHSKSNFRLTYYSDSACEDGPGGQSLAVCSRSCRTPILIDCDLGPEVLPNNTSHWFYTLQNLTSSFRWLVFTFREGFEVKAVKIYYICISTDHTEFNVDIQYSDSNTFSYSSPKIECSNSNYRKMLTIEIQGDGSQEIPPGGQIGMKIDLHYDITLYVSEIQFFKKKTVTHEGESSMECTAPTLTATSCVTSSTGGSNLSSPLTTSVPGISSNSLQSSDPGPTRHTPTPDNTMGGGGGGQGSVIAGAVAGTLVGVLVILIAVATVCLTVAVCVYKRRRRKAIEDTAMDRDGELSNSAYTATTLGRAVQTDNSFTNPTYVPSAIGQAVKTDDRFTNPTYSPTVVGHIASELQQYSTPSDPSREADAGPQYAVLGGPTPTAAASTGNQPPQYEDIDDFAPPNSSPAFVISDQPPPTARIENCNESTSPPHISELPQHAINVDLPTTTGHPHRDSPILEHTYSQLDRKLPGGNEVPNPSYSHVLHGPQNEEEGCTASDSTYSHLLHAPEGGDKEQQSDMEVTTQHTYSHLVCDGGGHDLTQNGASESAYSHISDCHT